MKRTLILLALLLPLSLSAQTKTEPEYKHDWRFGFAGYPLIDQLFFGYSHEPSYNQIDTDHVYGDYHGDCTMVGLFSAEYNTNITQRFTFALSGYLNTVWTPMYNYKGQTSSLKTGLSLHVIPTARFNYISRPAFSMYSSTLSKKAFSSRSSEMWTFLHFRQR